MFKSFNTNWNPIVPARLVFHENPLEAGHRHEASESPKFEGIPIPEVLKKKYLAHAGYMPNPRNRHRSKYLPVKDGVKAGYARCKTDKQREDYMRRYDRYDHNLGYNPVEASYQASLWQYDNMGASCKVAKIQIPTEEPELLEKNKNFLSLGGRIIKSATNGFPKPVDHIGNSADPQTALSAFNTYLNSSDHVYEGDAANTTVLLGFDEEIVCDPANLEANCKATRQLLEAIKASGMKAVMSTPLRHEKFPRTPYIDFLAECQQDDLVLLVGLGAALIGRNPGVKHEYLNDTQYHDQAMGLNKKGSSYAKYGFIAGVNILYGNRKLDDELLPIDRTSADAYAYYEGTNVAPSVPSFPNLMDNNIDDPKLKATLKKITDLHKDLDIGLLALPLHEIEERVDAAYVELSRVRSAGGNTLFAEGVLRREVGSIYFMRAWKALWKASGGFANRLDEKGRLRNRPKKSIAPGTAKKIQEEIDYARNKSNQYGCLTDMLEARLVRLEESLGNLQG